MLSASADAFASRITRMSWQGHQVRAVQDEWVVRMPTINAALTSTAVDDRTVPPAVPQGWRLHHVGLGMYRVTSPGATAAVVSQWATSQGSLWVQPNFVHGRRAVIPNEGAINPPTSPGFGSLWGLNNTGQIGGLDNEPTGTATGSGIVDADIDAPEAWAITTGSSNIVVAVLDDGIDYRHPDLQGNMWTRPATVPAATYGLNGWDSADVDGDILSADPADTHGTHVAGTIGAKANNALGVTGVAWDVKLYGGKVYSDGGLDYTSDVLADAIQKVIDLRLLYNQNIVAINFSSGGNYPFDQVENTAIAAANAAGILFVAAAGNGTDPIRDDGIGDDNDTLQDYPSNYPQPNIISVAASNRRDQLTNFSNYGVNAVDIAAPGSGIWSTVRDGLYEEWAGTSMAAPAVTGVAALVASAFLAEYGRLPTVAELKSAILDGADRPATLTYTESAANGDPFPGTIHQIAQNRRLNALGALHKALAYPEITIGDASIVEGHAGTRYADVLVSLSAASTRNVTVAYATADGTARAAGADYVAASGTLTFLPGETQKTIRVAINGDTTVEPDETLTVVLSNAVAGILDNDTLGTVTIQNDDVPPAVFVNDIQVVEGTGGTTTATFTIQLAGPMPSGVSVRYTTLDRTARTRDGDYRTVAGTAFIPAGQTSVAVPVSVTADAKYEADEKFVLQLVSATGVPITRSIAQCTILNDDPVPVPTVSISDVTLTEGNSAQKMFAFIVSLSERSTGTVSVGFQTVDGSALAGLDYVGRSGTLTFTPGVIARSITVWVTGDTTVEATERFSLQLLTPSGATLGRSTGIGTIVNDDKPAASRGVTATMFAAFAAEQSPSKSMTARRR